MAQSIVADLEKAVHTAMIDTICLVEIFPHVHEQGFENYASLSYGAMNRINDAIDTYMSHIAMMR